MAFIFWFEQLLLGKVGFTALRTEVVTLCMAFVSYTERPISALSLTGEAGAGLIWVDFNFVMSQQAPIRWALNSWAAQANHGHPNGHSKLKSSETAIWGDFYRLSLTVKSPSCSEMEKYWSIIILPAYIPRLFLTFSKKLKPKKTQGSK